MHELHLKQTGSSLLAVVAIVLLAVLIDLAAAPALADHKHRKRVQESRCEYEKVIAAGSYSRCLTKAIAHALVRGLEPSERAISRCDEDFDDAFARAEEDGECRTAGGPATIRGPIRAQVETMTADVSAGPGCPSNNLTVIAGETATCKVSTKEFRLMFVRDQMGWVDWLYDTKNRFYLRDLNQMATSNPIL